MNSPHTHDRDGAPPLSNSLKVHPGPGDVFATTGRGPSTHGLLGVPEKPQGRVSQEKDHGGWKDNSAHTSAGVAGGEKKDTVRHTR